MFKAICHRRCSTFHFRTLSQITVPHLPNHTTAPPTPTINPLHYHHHCQISTYSPQLKDNNSNEETNKNPIPPPKIFVVQPRLRPESVLKAKLSEALNLANSLEQQRDGYYDTEFSDKPLPPHLVVQNPAARTTRADTFFGPGTVSNIKCHMNALESEDELDAIFVNAILSGVQQRNLERAWDTPVLDRVGLIIEIFNAHAQTKEAKLQAELAALMYKKTRLVRVRGIDGRLGFGTKGESEVVSAKGRGSGGRGFISGAGETELQLQRRRILDRRIQLLSEIKDVRRTRAVQRAARRRRGGLNGEGMPTVAIVGYTNAGKSTLVSELSDSYLFCDDRLFATVDPKLRSVDLPSGKKVLLSDTVGFISDLPVQLVEAFHATLEEVVEADLLVHVLDSSAPDLEHQRESVLQVLQQIGVSKEKLQNMIEVWNKIDLQVEEFEEDDCVSEEEEEDEEISEDVEEVEDEKSEDLCDELLLLSEDENNENENENEIEMDYDIPNEQEREIINTDEKIWEKDIESIPHVKTSAITRVGLQDLLQLIDDKLKCDEIPERGIFDRKWRPPQLQDNGIAVEK